MRFIYDKTAIFFFPNAHVRCLPESQLFAQLYGRHVPRLHPIEAHWIWGGGWLSQTGSHDFADSCAIHMVGGICALSGAKILGPRIGKFVKDRDKIPVETVVEAARKALYTGHIGDGKIFVYNMGQGIKIPSSC